MFSRVDIFDYELIVNKQKDDIESKKANEKEKKEKKVRMRVRKEE